ncbi:MAG: glutathione peroxidase [Phycisphaerales bacterium]|nr:glutathione peroxidase [Phycisphaerales bacterium]
MQSTTIVLAVSLVVAGAALAAWGPEGEKPAGEKKACCALSAAASVCTDGYVLNHTIKAIDGTEIDLNSYKGKVVLIVNTASKCGLTPQYEGLQKLYEANKDKGLVILGFPANDFKEQEPGTNAQIATFCASTYQVAFPMFEKVTVLGKSQHPLYAQLTGQPEPVGSDIKWNFTKFLVDREGRVVARFEPKTAPDDAELVKKMEALLEAKPKDATPAAKPAPSGT